jgi:hypothetical protein
MGSAGGFNSLRISSANGSKTLLSMLVGGSNGAGAGSFRRMYSYSVRQQQQQQFLNAFYIRK